MKTTPVNCYVKHFQVLRTDGEPITVRRLACSSSSNHINESLPQRLVKFVSEHYGHLIGAVRSQDPYPRACRAFYNLIPTLALRAQPIYGRTKLIAVPLEVSLVDLAKLVSWGQRLELFTDSPPLCMQCPCYLTFS